MAYSGMGEVECGWFGREWWVGMSGTGGVEWVIEVKLDKCGRVGCVR